MKRFRTAVMLLVVCSCAGRAKQPSAAGPTPAGEPAFQQASAELYHAYFERIPAGPFMGTLGVSLGMHQYDGRLPDDSAAALQERAAFLADARAQLESFPASALSEGSRFERDVFAARLRAALFELTVRRTP